MTMTEQPPLLTTHQRMAVYSVWCMPFQEERNIACNQITGNALVARGLAEPYMVGTHKYYRLTDKGFALAEFYKRRLERKEAEEECENPVKN
jgi:hypothetical protein